MAMIPEILSRVVTNVTTLIMVQGTGTGAYKIVEKAIASVYWVSVQAMKESQCVEPGLGLRVAIRACSTSICTTL